MLHQENPILLKLSVCLQEYLFSYHKNLLKNVKGLLAIMGLKNIKQLDKNKLLFLDKNSRVHDNIDEVFRRKLDLGKNKGE